MSHLLLILKLFRKKVRTDTDRMIESKCEKCWCLKNLDEGYMGLL